MEEAAKCSISAIALTDHDTINGLAEAAEAAAARGIRFIPGIELQIVWPPETGGEFHLLGLGISRPSRNFTAAVAELARRRENRNMEILEKINEAGISVSVDELRAIASASPLASSLASPQAASSLSARENRNCSIGRPHFAELLVQRKIVKNREQAFLRYLSRGKPFYIPKAGIEFEQAAAVIKESGGLVVLAHPMSLYVAWGRLPALVENLKERGLDGIEAWHPSTRVSSCQRLEALGKQLGLVVTAGSDFHGKERHGRKLGITAGGTKISESFLESLSCVM